MKTTNYTNTFIEVADDCPASEGEIPPLRGTSKSAARIQFEMISENPYQYTSDDVMFETYAVKNGIQQPDRTRERELFFSKGQPCMRASALTKRYGWGVHSNENSKIALYPVGSSEYHKFSTDKNLEKLKAMRSKRG